MLMTVVYAGDSLESIRRWAQQLALRQVGDQAVTRLAIHDVQPLTHGELDPLVRGFALLPQAKNLSLARIEAEAVGPLEPAAPCTVALYDLLAGGAVERGRAVAVWSETRDRLTIAFVSDLHLAGFWDLIAAAVQRHAPDLVPQFLHPRLALEQFVREANKLWVEGELDLVVLGGDLVDHVHMDPGTRWHARPEETNLHGLLEALAGLRVPTLATPGNHDYRAFPWRPRSYGLTAVGIPAERSRALLRAAGLWSRWPLRLSDLSALRTEDDLGHPALSHYLTLVAPATDFAITLQGLQLVFASTGCDAMSRWRWVEGARLTLLWRAIRCCWSYPVSEGLYDEQVRQLAAALEDMRGAAVFLHAPLLYSEDGDRIGGPLGRLDLDQQTSLKARAAFERRLWSVAARRSALFRNPGPLLRAMLSAPGPLVAFSGHVHRSSALEVERRTQIVNHVGFDAPKRPGDSISLLTSPALGQLGPGKNGAPGYLLARFQAGALVGLQCRRNNACVSQ